MRKIKTKKELFDVLVEMTNGLNEQKLCICVDGDAGAGKSTLAKEIEEILDVNIVHTDHFYLPFNQRGTCASCHMNFDTIIKSVLVAFKSNQKIVFDHYDPHTDTVKNHYDLDNKSILVLEGSYSYHPSLRKYIDYSIALKIDEDKQKERIVKRSSLEIYEQFASKWISKEKTYQNETKLFEEVDILLDLE